MLVPSNATPVGKLNRELVDQTHPSDAQGGVEIAPMNRSIGRRQLIAGAAALAGSTLMRPERAAGATGFRAIALDGLVLFDPRPIAALVDRLFPEKGPELTNLWRVKQFDYQWLSALSGRYRDFEAATEGALVFAAKSLRVDLRPEPRERLMHAWLELDSWPDVAPALRSLKEAGLRLAPLANFPRRDPRAAAGTRAPFPTGG